MADEQYKWLDHDAVERLLRGEPLEAADADARSAADRLTGALDALTALRPDVPSCDAQLPGEEAALAAFRAAREGRTEVHAVLTGRARTDATAHSADGGPVRIGRPGAEEQRARWVRPVRFVMAAALTAGMLGGVAVAGQSGVLPTTFRDDRPEPASTVSAGATPGRPPMPPSPEGAAGGRDAAGGPDGTARSHASAQPGSKHPGENARGTGSQRGRVAACRDVRAGKHLDSGRERGLEEAAGGRGKVEEYCEGVLAGRDDRSAPGTSGDAPDGAGTRPGRDEAGAEAGRRQQGRQEQERRRGRR